MLNNDDPDKIESEEESVVVELHEASVESEGENEKDILQSADTSEQEMLASSVLGLFVSLSRVIDDDYKRSHKKLQSQLDKNLKKMIREKKIELGIK